MKSSRPNILHLFTDQQRFDTIAALGNSRIFTPHLDRLVREGTSFNRAYSPSPECVPARACMITGWYPGRTGCYSNEQMMPPEETPTFMGRLREAGYRTHGVGKCHFSPDPYASKGFETRQTQEERPRERNRDDYARWAMENGWDWVLEPHGVRGEMYYIPQPSVMPEHAHPTQWVADRALDFLDNQSDGEQPWYLYTSFVHPHPPFAPPIPWHKLYRAPDMDLPDLPENREELLTYVNYHQNRYKYRDRGLDINLVRCLRAYYYACISFIDAQIGRILQRLDATGQIDNTLILFSADHGEYLGDYGCFGKRGMHEVSARVPLIVRWPEHQRAGVQCEKTASLVDLAPTFLSAAGVTYGPQEFDGIDLKSVVDDSLGHRIVFSQYNQGENGLYMAVDENGKYIYSAPDNRELFFDLQKDPREHSNLASMETESFVRLRKACLQHVAAQGQKDAVENNSWRIHPSRQMPVDPDEGLIFQDPLWWDKKLPI